MMADPTKLPLGTSGFLRLRTSNQIYVDKTDMIFQMAQTGGKYFLSRPRRFGKTLLVSTLSYLFSKGLTYFKGLKIAELWKDKTYKVVKMALSDIQNYSNMNEMEEAFDSCLITAFESVDFSYKKGEKSCLDQIKTWLAKQEPNSLVLLVDEYDAPLNSHLDNPEFFNQIREMLSRFFLRIKDSDDAWRFIFITGIAKFNKASIFSAFNNLTDISLDPAYGTLLGYTEKEILENFKPFLDNAAQVNGMTTSALLEAMRAKYDGFCFDEEASTHVYAPWSVLSFLDNPRRGLQNFWYGSAGKSSIVENFFKMHPITNGIEDFGEDIRIDLDELKDSNDAETLSPAIFLFQAGYLAIKRTEQDTAYLNFPNGEVRHAMNRLMAKQMLKSKNIAATDLNLWLKAAQRGDVEALVKAMNDTFNQIDYLGYPLTQESHVRAAVQIYLMALRQGVTVERHYAGGRSDLEFDAGDFHWIMEFKYARKGAKRDKLLADALKQIEEKHYGDGSDIGNKTLLRVGIVFDGVKRQFVRYAELK